jgi:hypothetical protein
VQARIRLAAKVIFGVQKDLKKSSELLLAERFGSFLQSRPFVGGRGNQFGIRTAHTRDKHVAKMAEGFTAKMLEVLPLGEQTMHKRENTVGRSLFNRAGQLVENFSWHDAEQVANLRVRNI